MDKKTFIKELERSLSVLQEDELRDIIGEYEQHIDMKVQSGLTEEEAIADFGSLGQLTAEILEAYHVRADYVAADKEKGKRFSFADGEKAGKEILEQTGEICAKTGLQTVRGLKRIGAWLWGVVLFWKARISRSADWGKRKLTALMNGREKKMQIKDQEVNGQEAKDWEEKDWEANAGRGVPYRERRHTGRNLLKNAVSAVLGLMAGTVRFCMRAAGWCIRVAWNVCWAGFAVLCGGMGLFCLFGLGMLIVLLTQGYPLAGAVIGCLGLNFCLFAAAGFGMTLMCRKKRDPLKTENLPKKQEAADPEVVASVEFEKLEGNEHA